MFEILMIFFYLPYFSEYRCFSGSRYFIPFLSIQKTKHRSQREKWSQYFDKIGQKGLVTRLHISYMVALCLLATINYYSFSIIQSLIRLRY